MKKIYIVIVFEIKEIYRKITENLKTKTQSIKYCSKCFNLTAFKKNRFPVLLVKTDLQNLTIKISL